MPDLIYTFPMLALREYIYMFEVEARVLASRRWVVELESMHAEGERMKAAMQELDNLKRIHSCVITRV